MQTSKNLIKNDFRISFIKNQIQFSHFQLSFVLITAKFDMPYIIGIMK